jgi:hypothetical protein
VQLSKVLEREKGRDSGLSSRKKIEIRKVSEVPQNRL